METGPANPVVSNPASGDCQLTPWPSTWLTRPWIPTSWALGDETFAILLPIPPVHQSFHPLCSPFQVWSVNPANVYTANVYTAGSTSPFSTPTCELGKENSSHVSSCTLYWVGVISSIANILLRERVPRKEETGCFSSAHILLTGATLSSGQTVMSPKYSTSVALCSVGHDAPKAKKPLWKINHIEQFPPTRLPPFPRPTGRPHLSTLNGDTLLQWLHPNLVWGLGAAREAEEVWVMVKTKNTCIPYKNKGEMFSLTPSKTKTFAAKKRPAQLQ